MEQLNKQKLTEEIKSLKTERLVSLIKGIALLIGSIVLFIAIQRPESILNRKLSQETISRERAKLVFELTQQNKNAKEVLFGLSIIEKAYPEESSKWIREVKGLYKTKLQGALNDERLSQIDSIYQEQLYQLRIKLQRLLYKKEKYQVDFLAELNGSGVSRMKGYGSRAKIFEEIINEAESEIKELQTKINKLEAEIDNNKKIVCQ